jgi:hypothetical protein
MKNLLVIALFITSIFTFTQCAEKSAEVVLKDQIQRREVIALIVSHEPY